MTHYSVDSLLKRNPLILNSRPHYWRTIRRYTCRSDAEAYAKELRQGAKQTALPCRYRVKAVSL
jgi:hypothetical protein